MAFKRGFVALGCVIAVGGGGSDSGGQTTDYTHQWVRGFGSTEQDYGRGIAVWYDGTAVSASEVRGQVPGAPGQPRAEATFTDRTGVQLWRHPFQPQNMSSASAALAAATGIPDVEQSGSQRVGYSTGWFEGTVQFHPGFTDTLTAAARNTFVAKLSQGAPNDMPWRTQFISAGVNEGLCVAAGYGCEHISCGGATSLTLSALGAMQAAAAGPSPPAICPCPFVVVGGYFTAQTQFGLAPGSPVVTATSGEDGYIAALTPVPNPAALDGQVRSVLHLAGGDGPVRVTGIAVNLNTNDVAVTGHYSDSQVNFNPNATAVRPLGNYVGQRDAFVVLYGWAQLTPLPEPQNAALVVKWAFWRGTSGDDSGQSVAIDSAGNVYVTGYLADAGGKGDIWLAKYGVPAGGGAVTQLWERIWTGEGDDRGSGVTIDGIDRVLLTGQFGKARGSGTEIPTYCLDFDPSAGTDQRCTNGGLDVFVSRFRPDAAYDWTFTAGGDRDDAGTAIGVDPAATGRLAHAGWFGSPNATTSYSVDFDPGTGSAPLGSAGKADAFVNFLRPTPPTGVVNQVSLVIDNSLSVTGPTGDNDYAVLMDALRTGLASTAVVPQNSTVSMNVVYYGMTGYLPKAVPVMPWTVMTPVTAPLFANRLAQQRRLLEGGNLMGDGLKVATDALVDYGIGAAPYASLLVIGDEIEEPGGTIQMPAARTYALAVDRFDRLDGYGVREEPLALTRQWCLDNLVGSRIGTNPAVLGDASIGFAGEPSTTGSTLGFQHPDFGAVLHRMIQRMTACPSDYDRNGFFDPIADLNQFVAASFANAPYADWNFDGTWNGHLGGIDRQKFDAGGSPVACPP